MIIRFLQWIDRHPRWVVVAGSLLVSLFFVGLKSVLLDGIGVQVQENLGQIEANPRAFYELGDYTVQVTHLIRDGSLVTEEGKVLNRYPPLYPLMVYLAFSLGQLFSFSFATCLFLLTTFCNTLSALLVFELSRRLLRNNLAGVMGGLLFATHPYVLQGLTKAMSVTPFMTLLLAALLGFFILLEDGRRRQGLGLLAVGLLLGLAILTRPIGLFIPLLFGGLYLLFAHGQPILRRAMLAGLLIGGSVLAVLPWQAFNYARGERILLSSDRVTSLLDGVSFNNHPRKEKLPLPEDVDALARRLSTSEVESKGEFFGEVWRELQVDPAPVVKLYVIKAARSWYGAFAQNTKKELIKLAISLLYLSLAVVGLFLLDYRLPRTRLYVAALVLLTLYFWAMTILVVSMVRYLIPVFGLLCVYIPAIGMKYFRRLPERGIRVSAPQTV